MVLDIARRVAGHDAEGAGDKTPSNVGYAGSRVIRQGVPSRGSQVKLMGRAARRTLINDHDRHGGGAGVFEREAGAANLAILIIRRNNRSIINWGGRSGKSAGALPGHKAGIIRRNGGIGRRTATGGGGDLSLEACNI